jgi:hypothetical protein
MDEKSINYYFIIKLINNIKVDNILNVILLISKHYQFCNNFKNKSIF